MRKDPNAVLPFAVDWTDWLTNEGDTASSFDWILPADLVSEDETTSAGKSTVWLSGGIAGKIYRVTNRITTAGGRIDDRTLTIQVQER